MISRVSIALVTRNGMPLLREVVHAIRVQRSARVVEIVAVDSASNDGTAEFLREAADVFLEIAAADFDHGATRNLAIEHCSGEAVVLLVQDAVPSSDDWLEQLLGPLDEDPGVAGVFARQLLRPDAGRLTRWNLERWLAARPEARVSAVEDVAAFEGLTPLERMNACVFDNVCSCVRRSVWRQRPFPATPIAEDLEWAKEVLLAGHSIAYAPKACVVHSHERSLRYELDRTVLVHQRLRTLFGVRTIPTLAALMRSFPITVVDHVHALRSGEGNRPSFREVARALGLAIVWPLGQYLGGRDARS